MRYILFSALLLVSSPVWAQSKFFSTPNRGGVEGAKQNVMLTMLQNEQQRMNTCTASGMIYGPTHPQATASGCIPGLVMQEQGHAWFSGNLGIGAPAIDAGGVRLYVSGAIKIGNAASCASETEGSLRYNEMVKRMEFCNGTEWGAMGGGGAVCQAGKTLNICRRYRRYSPTSGWSDTGYGCSPIDGGYLVSNIGDDTGWKNQTLEIALRCQ